MITKNPIRYPLWDDVEKAVLESLPDSVSKRRALLNALVRVMPVDAAGSRIREILTHLDAHIVAVRERQSEFDFPGGAQ